jgi:hypothetical protein
LSEEEELIGQVRSKAISGISNHVAGSGVGAFGFELAGGKARELTVQLEQGWPSVLMRAPPASNRILEGSSGVGAVSQVVGVVVVVVVVDRIVAVFVIIGSRSIGRGRLRLKRRRFQILGQECCDLVLQILKDLYASFTKRRGYGCRRRGGGSRDSFSSREKEPQKRRVWQQRCGRPFLGEQLRNLELVIEGLSFVFFCVLIQAALTREHSCASRE